jgi:hypothetical protein
MGWNLAVFCLLLLADSEALFINMWFANHWCYVAVHQVAISILWLTECYMSSIGTSCIIMNSVPQAGGNRKNLVAVPPLVMVPLLCPLERSDLTHATLIAVRSNHTFPNYRGVSLNAVAIIRLFMWSLYFNIVTEYVHPTRDMDVCVRLFCV